MRCSVHCSASQRFLCTSKICMAYLGPICACVVDHFVTVSGREPKTPIMRLAIIEEIASISIVPVDMRPSMDRLTTPAGVEGHQLTPTAQGRHRHKEQYILLGLRGDDGPALNGLLRRSTVVRRRIGGGIDKVSSSSIESFL